MIDFLVNCGISKMVINQIKDMNVYENLYNFSCNQDNVEKIIGYLKELNFEYVEDLLINKLDLFFLTFTEFKNKYNRDNFSDLMEVVEL